MSNELTTKQTSAPVSVFDDFEQFQNALRMAEALSKTKLIPQNFQGCPEDCLIAIDYSRRLGLPPTAVLPHLYVIGGRPSSSAQFMISLVNRSGQFSRIQWDERVDGQVDFVINGQKKSVPNYSAIAWFEEVASGRRFESPVIDVKFAYKNGWLVKKDKYGKETESKWQTMPEVMCRYRSASILIKSVCPELALGMECAEDVADGVGDSLAGLNVRQVAPITNDQPAETIEAVVIEPAKNDNAQESEFYALKDAIETADGDALRTIGRKIADSGLSAQYLDELRTAFKNRRAELAAANRQPAPEPAEKKDKPSARKKAATKSTNETDAKTKPERAAELATELSNATNYRDLNEIWSRAEGAIVAGDITSAQYTELEPVFNERIEFIKGQLADRENALFEQHVARLDTSDGDKDQKIWARELMSTILSQTNAAIISKNNLATADEWLASGALTQSLRGVVVDYARARLDSFFE